MSVDDYLPVDDNRLKVYFDGKKYYVDSYWDSPHSYIVWSYFPEVCSLFFQDIENKREEKVRINKLESIKKQDEVDKFVGVYCKNIDDTQIVIPPPLVQLAKSGAIPPASGSVSIVRNKFVLKEE